MVGLLREVPSPQIETLGLAIAVQTVHSPLHLRQDFGNCRSVLRQVFGREDIHHPVVFGKPPGQLASQDFPGVRVNRPHRVPAEIIDGVRYQYLSTQVGVECRRSAGWSKWIHN